MKSFDVNCRGVGNCQSHHLRFDAETHVDQFKWAGDIGDSSLFREFSISNKGAAANLSCDHSEFFKSSECFANCSPGDVKRFGKMPFRG